MIRDRILELFKECPPDVRKVVAEVIRLEQEHITMERPRVREPIRQIIERMANEA